MRLITIILLFPLALYGQGVTLPSAMPQWQIEHRTSLTNSDDAYSAIWSNAVPDGQTRLYSVDVLMAGATNHAALRLFSTVANRAGSATAANWFSETNYSAGAVYPSAYLTNVSTQAVLYARGPTNEPWNIFARGMYQVVTNGNTNEVVDSFSTDLVGYWKLDEESGNRADISGNNITLTNYNTVSFAADAKAGSTNSADFESVDSDYLRTADSATLSLGADTPWTLTVWAKMESSASTRVIVMKRNGTSAQDSELVLATDLTKAWARAANGSTYLDVTNSTTINTGTWYFIAAWHDPDADTINISVNNGTAASSSWSGGTINDGSGTFTVGATQAGSANWDGLLSHLGYWKRVLTADERTTLYNSGNGYNPFE